MKQSVAASLVLVLALVMAPPSWGQSRRSAKAPDEAVVQRISAALDALEADGDLDKAERSIHEVYTQVVAWGAENEPQTLREVVLARRLVRLAEETQEDGVGLVRFLRERPTFAGDLLFLMDESVEGRSEIAAVVQRLRATGVDRFEEIAPLAAAICVVHDQPVMRRFNENMVVSPDAEALYEYYASNAGRMYFDTGDFPPELYTFVVDATPSIDEMTWALDRYARHNDVGSLFNTIRYDLESFVGGRDKGVTTEGYTLANILRFGGVCVDQAYFAVMVGKSIGVPTAYVTAAAAEGGHAWVGFLQRSGKGANWNFSTGRYDAYKGLKGRVLNPQTGEDMSDGEITLAAGLIGFGREERQQAIAYLEAASHLRMVADKRLAWPPERPEAAPKTRTRAPARGAPAARTADAAGVLGTMRASTDHCPYHLQSWRFISDTANVLGFSDEQREEWIESVRRFCGADYPDFTIAVLRGVIDPIEDAREKDRIWESLLKLCNQRPDLAAEVLVEQGLVWEKAGDADTALECYRTVIDKHTEDGPFILTALRLSDQLLTKEGRVDEALRLHQTTWGRCRKPESSAYYRIGSNWFRVGLMYSMRLRAAGDAAEAQRVADALQR